MHLAARLALNNLRIFLAFIGGVSLFVTATTPLFATPLDWGKDSKGDTIKPRRWPANKSINIYIETDPDADPPDRSALLKEGMDRWAAIMSPRGITITVIVGAVPTPAPQNLVRCRYRPAGTKLEGAEGALGPDNKGLANCSEGSNDDLAGGEIAILDTVEAGTDDEKDSLRNLGQHEITHVLGLADDDNGTVTDHEQDSTPNTYNDTDTKEIGTLYPVLPQEAPKGEGEHQQSSNPNQHSYDFQYNGSGDGHVSLINLDIDPSIVVQVIPPPGWIALNPADPAHLNPNYPFYQNYMVDGTPSKAPWNPQYTAPVSIRALNETATLSATHPQIQMTVITANASLGTIKVWAGREIQVLPGPVPVGAIPTASQSGMVVMVLLAALVSAVMLRRSSQIQR